MLYLGTGDAAIAGALRTSRIWAAAFCALTPEGEVPDDNPWPGNPIWAYGFRNTTGLAFRPSDGTLFAADHRPDSEWEPRIGAYDELNIIEKGANYGLAARCGRTRRSELCGPDTVVDTFGAAR